MLVLTTCADDRSALDALRAGARGYLTKDAGAQEIQQALQQIAGNRHVIDPAIQHHLIDAITTNDRRRGRADGDRLPDEITPREAEVLCLIAAGLSNAEIAQRLIVTENTVKSHINHLSAKIRARYRAQAVTYAAVTASPSDSSSG